MEDLFDRNLPESDDENKKKKAGKGAVKGGLWAMSSEGMRTISQLVATMFLARILTPADFGVVAIAQTINQFGMVLTMMGMLQTIIQTPEFDKRHATVAFYNSVFSGILISGSVFLAAPIVQDMMRMNDLANVMRIVSVTLLLASITRVPFGLLMREQRYRRIAFSDVLVGDTLMIITSITLAMRGWGPYSIAAGMVVQSVTRALMMAPVLRGWLGAKFDWSIHKQISGTGRRFAAAQMLAFAGSNADRFVVGRVLGADALGLYARSFTLLKGPAYLMGRAMEKVLFPKMSRVQESSERLATMFSQTIVLYTIALLPLSAFGFIQAKEIIHTWLGTSKWDQVIVLFQIMVALQLFRGTYRLADTVNKARGSNWDRVRQQAVNAAGVVACSWIGSYYGGLIGAAWGLNVSLTINYIGLTRLALKETGLTWFEMIRAHLPGVRFTLAIIALLWPVTYALQQTPLSAPWILLIGFATYVIGGTLILRVLGKPILGPRGVEVLRLFGQGAPGPLRKVMKRAIPWAVPPKKKEVTEMQTRSTEDFGPLAPMANDVFFIVGSGRCGTTLLQVMLDMHSQIAVRGESHYFNDFVPNAKEAIGDLNSPEQLDAAIERAKKHRHLRLMKFDWMDVRTIALQAPLSYTNLFLAMMESLRRKAQRPRIGEKTPAHVVAFWDIYEELPDAKIIHLVRDPRAVITSWLKVEGFGNVYRGNPMRAVEKWKIAADRHLEATKRAEPSRYLVVRYEDLVSDPETQLRRICEHLGIDFEPAMLEFHKRSDLGFTKGSEHKMGTTMPVYTDSLSKWRKQITPEQLEVVEASLAEPMRVLGYELDNGQPTEKAVQKARHLAAKAKNQLFWHRVMKALKLRKPPPNFDLDADEETPAPAAS